MTFDIEVLRAILEVQDSQFNSALTAAEKRLADFATKTFPAVKIKVDAEGAIKEVTDLGRAMRAIVDKNVTVKVSAQGAIAEVTALGKAMEQVQAAAQRTSGTMGGRGGVTSFGGRSGAWNNTPEEAYDKVLKEQGKRAQQIEDKGHADRLRAEQTFADDTHKAHVVSSQNTLKAEEAAAAARTATLRNDIQTRLNAQVQGEERIGAAMAQTMERQQRKAGTLTDRFGNPINPAEKPGLDERINNLQNSGYRQLRAGSILTASITAPLVGAGTELVRYAADFQETMAKTAALTEIGAAGVQQYSKAILDLTQNPQIRQTPVELGDAFFYAASKTKNATDAMDVLKASAIGSSAGLGKVRDVVEGVTTVLNAYHLSGDKAAHVTDIFVQAAKEGGVAADTFAKALPKVVAVSAGVGVSIEEVTASIATMTRVGIPAGNAATALNRLLLNMEKPSKQAAEAIDKLHLSFAELRIELREKGLLEVLEKVYKAAGGNLDVLAPIFGSVNSFKAVLATAGTQAETYEHILLKMIQSQGAAADAAATATKTFEAQLDHLKSVGATLAIEFGNKLLPTITQIAQEFATRLPGAIRTAVNAWNLMPEPIKAVTVGLIGLLALAGPLNMMAGTVKILGAALMGLAESAGIIAAFNALKVQFSAGLAFGLPGAGAALSNSFAPLIAVATNPYVLAFLAGTAVIGVMAWSIFADNMRNLGEAQDNLKKNSENLNKDLANLAHLGLGVPQAASSIVRISQAAQDAGNDLTKLGDMLRLISESKHQIKNLHIDPVAAKILEDEYDRIAERIHEKIIKVKIEADASSAGFLSWLADAGTGFKDVAYELTGGMMGQKAPRKAYDASTPTTPTQSTVNIPLPPGWSKKDIDDLTRITTMQNAVHGNTAQQRVNAVNQMGLDTLSEAELTRIKRGYSMRIQGGYQPTAGEDVMLGDVQNKLKGINDDRRAQAKKNADDAADRARIAAAATKEAAEKIAAQRRELAIAALNADVQHWNAFKQLTDNAGVAIEQIGDKTQRTKMEAALLKDQFADIPKPLRDMAIAMAEFSDRLHDIIGLRDKLRGIFNPVYVEARDLGQATSLDQYRAAGGSDKPVNPAFPLDDIRNSEIGMDIAGSITQNRDAGLAFMRAIGGQVNRRVAGDRTAIRRIQKQGDGEGGAIIPTQAQLSSLARMDAEGMAFAGKLLGVSEPPSSWGKPADKVDMQPGESRATELAVQNLLRDHEALGKLRTTYAEEFRSKNQGSAKYRGARGAQQLNADAGAAFDNFLPGLRFIAKDSGQVIGVGQQEEVIRQKTRELQSKTRLIARDNNPYSAWVEELYHGAAAQLWKGGGEGKRLIDEQTSAILNDMSAATTKMASDFKRDRLHEIEPIAGASPLLEGSGFSRAAYDKSRAMIAAQLGIQESPQIKADDAAIAHARELGDGANANALQKQRDLAVTQMLTDAEKAYNEVTGEGARVAYAESARSQRESISLLQYEIGLLGDATKSRESMNDALEVEKTYRQTLKDLESSYLPPDAKEFMAQAAGAAKGVEISTQHTDDRIKATDDYTAALGRNIDLLQQQKALYGNMGSGSLGLEKALSDIEIENRLNEKYASKRDKSGSFINPGDATAYGNELTGDKQKAEMTRTMEATKRYGEAVHSLDREFATLGDTTGLVAAHFDLLQMTERGAADATDLIAHKVELLKRTMGIETAKGIFGSSSQFDQQFMGSARARLLEENRLRDLQESATFQGRGARFDPALQSQRTADDRRKLEAADELDRRTRVKTTMEQERDLMLLGVTKQADRLAIEQNITRAIREREGLGPQTDAEFNTGQDALKYAHALDVYNSVLDRATERARMLGGAIEDGIKTGFDKGAKAGLMAFAEHIRSDILGRMAHQLSDNITTSIFGDPTKLAQKAARKAGDNPLTDPSGLMFPAGFPALPGFGTNDGLEGSRGDGFNHLSFLQRSLNKFINPSSVAAAGPTPIGSASFTIATATIMAPNANVMGLGGGIPLPGISTGAGTSPSPEQAAQIVFGGFEIA